MTNLIKVCENYGFIYSLPSTTSMYLDFILWFLIIYNVEGKVITNRIVGGRPAEITEIPFQLSLHYNRAYICGAILIKPNIGLTANHCVYKLNATNFFVRAGDSYLGRGIRNNVSAIESHPRYNPVTLKNDLALLKLNDYFNLDSKLNTINLPLQNSEVPDGSVCTTSGWGQLGEDSPGASLYLMIVQVAIVNHKICQKAYFSNVITKDMICAGENEGGKDSCYGDSGGPLVYNHSIRGIVSWGNGCGRKKFPGIYTKVSKYVNFIEYYSKI